MKVDWTERRPTGRRGRAKSEEPEESKRLAVDRREKSEIKRMEEASAEPSNRNQVTGLNKADRLQVDELGE